MGKKYQKSPAIKLQHIQQTPKPKLEPQPVPTPLKKQKRQAQPKLEQTQQGKAPEASNAEQKKRQKKIKRARLIIRNLVFDINEKHIQKLISPFGQIKQINIPKHPDRNGSRGFAFVQMANKNQCLKAMKELNGTTFKGRTIVLDLAVSKENFMTEKLNDKDNAKGQLTQPKQQEMEDENSQNKPKIEQGMQEQNQEDQQSQQSQAQQQQDPQQKARKQQEDHSHQIFIRNLPISVTEDDLHKHFSRNGKIKFVRVVKNKETNVSKGTAFIKFYDTQTPSKLIQYSRSYEMFLLKKHNNFVADPMIRLEIDGAIMKIFPVQTRKGIEGKLKQRQGTEVDKKNIKPVKKIKKIQDLVKTDIHGKRRLQLSLMGLWRADDSMPKPEYEQMKSHQRQKLQKLKNPNNQISSTRILLKHLQKQISESNIKELCYKFLADNSQRNNSLTFCKLMLDRDRNKSAGFAFVQFSKHQIAKQFIQMLVQEPRRLQNKRFIVQFAIQDSRKMMKLMHRNKANNNDNVTKQSKKETMNKSRRAGKGGKEVRVKQKQIKRKIIKK